MGQKKIKIIGEKIRVAGLKGGERIKVVDSEPTKTPAKETVAKEKKTKKEPKIRSKKYQAAKAKVKTNKAYSLAEAIKLVKKTSISSFTGNLETHLVVKPASRRGELGKLLLPHFKGKAKKVVIANEKILEQIKTNKIDFDVLLASPKMMPKIVPFARMLGPKGLMPNPKNGTLVDDPEKAIKSFSGQAIKIKTEKKAPVVHLVLGKLDQPDKELIANVETLIKILGPSQIKKLVLKATMGPGVRVKL